MYYRTVSYFCAFSSNRPCANTDTSLFTNILYNGRGSRVNTVERITRLSAWVSRRSRRRRVAGQRLDDAARSMRSAAVVQEVAGQGQRDRLRRIAPAAHS